MKTRLLAGLLLSGLLCGVSCRTNESSPVPTVTAQTTLLARWQLDSMWQTIGSSPTKNPLLTFEDINSGAEFTSSEWLFYTGRVVEGRCYYTQQGKHLLVNGVKYTILQLTPHRLVLRNVESGDSLLGKYTFTTTQTYHR